MRVVELTACASGCTVLTILKDIIRVEYKIVSPFRVKATLTEVIISLDENLDFIHVGNL